MSREEAMKAFIESGMELRRDDIELGKQLERERIIELLKPLAEHDEEMCYYEGKLWCWPDDCSAPLYQYAIDLIKGEQK